MTQHTPEFFPEFEHHPNYGKRLALGNDAVILNRNQYNRARACVNACAGMTIEELDDLGNGGIKEWMNDADETLKAVCAALDDVEYLGRCELGIYALKEQRDELLAAMKDIKTAFDTLPRNRSEGQMIKIAIEAIAKAGDK